MVTPPRNEIGEIRPLRIPKVSNADADQQNSKRSANPSTLAQPVAISAVFTI
jgi:hypothetical protein